MEQKFILGILIISVTALIGTIFACFTDSYKKHKKKFFYSEHEDRKTHRLVTNYRKRSKANKIKAFCWIFLVIYLKSFFYCTLIAAVLVFLFGGFSGLGKQ